jgi:hypothetical protein
MRVAALITNELHFVYRHRPALSLSDDSRQHRVYARPSWRGFLCLSETLISNALLTTDLVHRISTSHTSNTTLASPSDAKTAMLTESIFRLIRRVGFVLLPVIA